MTPFIAVSSFNWPHQHTLPSRVRGQAWIANIISCTKIYDQTKSSKASHVGGSKLNKPKNSLN